MASTAQTSLKTAVSAVDNALDHLEAAIDIAVNARGHSAAALESMQAEITRTWESHTAKIESELTQAASENDFLKEDNLRLSNQLQKLQKDFLELQQLAGNAVGRLDASVKQLDMILEH